jgi:hypothetical protein
MTPYVTTEINVVEKNFYNSDSVFNQDGNIVVRLNLLYGVINKNTNFKLCGGHILLFENPSNRRGIVSNLVIKCYQFDHPADVLTSHITRSRLYDNMNSVYGLRSIDKGRDTGKMLHAVMNIPQPPTSFSISNKSVSSAMAGVSESSVI